MVKSMYRLILTIFVNYVCLSSAFNLQQLLPLFLDTFISLVARPLTTDDNAGLPEGFLFTGDLVKQTGYRFEAHAVTTEDGYILQLNRVLPVSSKRKKRNSGFPVLLQHGLLASSDTWLLLGNRSLPYTLVDNGYDVWIGDQRGNPYSRRHVKYKVQDLRYWNFTFHECGVYDMPAFIDYILETTGQPQLYYIGHSMGTTVFLTMASLKPEYNNKVRTALLLAPVATCPTLSELTNPMMRLFLLQSDVLWDRLKQRKLVELMPRSGAMVSAIRKLCSPESSFLDFCIDFIGMVYGENRKNLDRNKIGEKMTYVPSGAAALVVHHLAQIYKGDFRMYDYGKRRNMMTYGSAEPPLYPLDKVTAPVATIFGDNDRLVNERSVNSLIDKLPNVIMNKKVEDPHFTHGDFIIGENARTVLYDKIVDLFNSRLNVV